MNNWRLKEEQSIDYSVSEQRQVAFRELRVIFSPHYFQNDQFVFVPVHVDVLACVNDRTYWATVIL